MTGALAEDGADGVGGVGGGEEGPAPKRRKSKKRRVDELLVAQVMAPQRLGVASADVGPCAAWARIKEAAMTARLTQRGRAGAGGRFEAGGSIHDGGECDL